ncbi:MAG: HEAT repeat domain-containing protein, partial [Planctomycetes bacterium]|nr:HEAT repeat domain-containing protein [Planctomycetota bacterium]
SGTDSQFGKNLEVTRSTAVSSIAAAGIDWLPLLIEKLRSPESFVRTFAANGIERMGTRANSAIPALVSALREESSVIAVAHAIARMANDPGFSFSPRRRLQVLSANPERERALREAAQSMGRLGPEVMPFLMSRLNDESPTVRAFAAHSLGAIGAAANSAVPALIAGLRDERVAPAFMEGLSDIGPAAAAKLLDAVRSGDPESKKAIFAALADLGKGAAFALPALIEGLRDSDNETRNAAMEAIVLIGGDAVPMLISALGDSRCREWAALSLHLIGPWSAPAVPALTDLLLDDDYRIVGHAADALRAIGSAAEPAVDAMCKRLDDSNPLVRRRALFALGALRGLAKGAVARIEAALKDPDGNVRKFAHDALYNIQQDR